MAIEIRQPGGAKGAAQAGQIIGTAQKIKREQEQAFQLASEQRARQWELEKMEMRSQQEFAHELRMRQAELDKETRAQEWDVEKMEIRSRMDFAENEKKRQQEMARGKTMLESINKAYDSGKFDRDNPPPELVAREAYARDLAESGDTASPTLYLPREKKQTKQEQLTEWTLSNPEATPEEIQDAMTRIFSGKKEEKETPEEKEAVKTTPAREFSKSRVVGTVNTETGKQIIMVENSDGNIVEKSLDEEVIALGPDGSINSLTMKEYMENSDKYQLTNLNSLSPIIMNRRREAEEAKIREITKQIKKGVPRPGQIARNAKSEMIETLTKPSERQAWGEKKAEKRYGSKESAAIQRLYPKPTWWEHIYGRMF